MLKIGFIGVMIFVSLGASAKVQTKAVPIPTTKETMWELLEPFLKLKKYLVSDEEFQNPKNELEISNYLKALSVAVKKTSHDPLLNQENFKFSREVLEDHVSEAERVFRMGSKSYARWMTNSTLGICMSCHTQMPTQERQFAVFTKADFLTSKFDQAEFLFATKNFEGASKTYKEMILEYPKNALSSDKLEKSVVREISYQLRVKRDYKTALSDIAEFRSNKKLPEFLLRNLAEWSEQIEQWQKRKVPDVATAKDQDITSFAKANLSSEAVKGRLNFSDPKFISNLVVSSVLYEYLQKNPGSPAVPEELYWLAIIDREMSHSAFYSLADMYLKECMLKFPTSPFASKCYKEYESEIILGYTGSAGIDVPKEVLADLKYLKSFVESKGKVPLKRSIP